MSFIAMACEHTEDVCQNCLQKVQREEEEKYSQQKTNTKKYPRQRTDKEKANSILIGGIAIGILGYAGFWGAKLFKDSFNSGVFVLKEVLRTFVD